MRTSTTRGTFALGLATIGVLAWAASAGETLLLHAPAAEDTWGALGGRDLNGDGIPDHVIGDTTDSGTVTAFSGRTNGVLYSIVMDDVENEPDRRVFRFGLSLAWVGDVDGDDVDDYVVGAPNRSGRIGTEPAGRAVLVSGATGEQLYRVDGGPDTGNTDYFGFVVSGCGGDATGDGIPDFVVGLPGVGGAAPGGLRGFSGADGSPIGALHLIGDGLTENLGTAIVGLGDVDGDGLADIAASAPEFNSRSGIRNPDASTTPRGRVDIISSQAGVLHSIVGRPGQVLGRGLANVGDIDADGFDDLAITSNAFRTPFVIQVHSGKSGRKIRVYRSPTRKATLPLVVAAAGDVNRDGSPDIAFQDPEGGDDAGALYILSGARRDQRRPLLFVCDIPQSIETAAIAPAGDRNADGTPDLLVSYVDSETFRQEVGLLMVTGVDPYRPGRERFNVGSYMVVRGDPNARGRSTVSVRGTTTRMRFSFSRLPSGGPFPLFVADGLGSSSFTQVGSVSGTRGVVTLDSRTGLPAPLAGIDPKLLGGRRLELRNASGAVLLDGLLPYFTAPKRLRLAFAGTPASGSSVSASIVYQSQAKRGLARLQVNVPRAPRGAQLALQREFPAGSGEYVTLGDLNRGVLRIDAARGAALPEDIAGVRDFLRFGWRLVEVIDAEQVRELVLWQQLRNFDSRPDLIVTKVRFKYLPYADAYQISVDVKNQGLLGTGPVNVKVGVSLDDDVVRVLEARTTVSFPTAHEEKRIPFGFLDNPLGSRSQQAIVVAIVDPTGSTGGTGEYLEANENNNRVTEIFLYDAEEDDYDRL